MMRLPGFVDIQVNGLLGVDFSAPGLTIDGVRKVTRELAARGTVAYCPTVCTCPDGTYREVLPVLAASMDDRELSSHILGIHLEGPFISQMPGARGAHRQDCIREPSCGYLDELMALADGRVSILTLAPEMPGAQGIIRHARELGIVVSVGHHYADDRSLSDAVGSGAVCSTHLGNGIPNEVHRHNNPLWWQLACDELSVSCITDGHHLPASFISVALKCKSADRFIVVSDASPLAGLPPGEYRTFAKDVVIEPSGRIFCPETGGLAGSHSTMIECMNHLSSLGLLSANDLRKVGYENPLRHLRRGDLCVDGALCQGVRFEDGLFRVG